MSKIIYIPNGEYLVYDKGDRHTVIVEELRPLKDMLKMIIQNAGDIGNRGWVEKNKIKLPILLEELEVVDDLEYMI